VKKAFLLIEMMFGIVILSISILALVKLNGVGIFKLEHMKEKLPMVKNSAIMISYLTVEYNKRSRTAYDILSKVYNIDNFDAKKVLSKEKYDIEVSKYSILNIPQLDSIDIKQVRLKNKKGKTKAYYRLSDG
jgi:hypothetical protein